MRQTALRRSCAFIFLLLTLNACTGGAVKKAQPGNPAAYQDRAETLAAIAVWSFVARISLDDGDQGGSGRLQWMVKTGSNTLDFHGAMGRGAWHLQFGPEGAVLKEADGTVQEAEGVNALIQDRLGWAIPVDALQWWVRGLAAPGSIEDEKLDSAGLLISLDQFGWHVEFDRYDSISGIALPKKLNARRDNYRVKLAINRWRMDMNHASTN